MQVEGVVTRLEEQTAYVQVRRERGCGRCHEAGGCRSGLPVDPNNLHCQEYALENACGANPGNRVTIEVPEGATLKAVSLAYVLPVFALLVFSGLGQWVFGSDLGAFMAGLCGLVLAVFILKRYGKAASTHHPRIVGIIQQS